EAPVDRRRHLCPHRRTAPPTEPTATQRHPSGTSRARALTGLSRGVYHRSEMRTRGLLLLAVCVGLVASSHWPARAEAVGGERSLFTRLQPIEAAARSPDAEDLTGTIAAS